MPTVRWGRWLLFGSSRGRRRAGTGRDELPGVTVGEVLAAARPALRLSLQDVLGTCKIWVNGEPAGPSGPRSAPPMSWRCYRRCRGELPEEVDGELQRRCSIREHSRWRSCGCPNRMQTRTTWFRTRAEWRKPASISCVPSPIAATGVTSSDDLSSELRVVLSHHLTGGTPRPPRPSTTSATTRSPHELDTSARSTASAGSKKLSDDRAHWRSTERADRIRAACLGRPSRSLRPARRVQRRTGAALPRGRGHVDGLLES